MLPSSSPTGLAALTPRPRGEGRDGVVVVVEGRRREGRRDVAVANSAAAPSPPRQGEEREVDVPACRGRRPPRLIPRRAARPGGGIVGGTVRGGGRDEEGAVAAASVSGRDDGIEEPGPRPSRRCTDGTSQSDPDARVAASRLAPGFRRSEWESQLARGGKAASSPARRAAATMSVGRILDGGGSFLVMAAEFWGWGPGPDLESRLNKG